MNVTLRFLSFLPEDIYYLPPQKYRNIKSDDGIFSRIDRESGSAEAEPRHSIENKTLVVTTIKSPPYAMFKQSPER